MAQLNAQTKKIITTLVVFVAAIGAVAFVALSSGKFFTEGRFDIRPRASSANCPAGVCPGSGRRYPAVTDFSGNCGQYIQRVCQGSPSPTVRSQTPTPTSPRPQAPTTNCTSGGECAGKNIGATCSSNRGVCQRTQGTSCDCVIRYVTPTPTTRR